MHSSDARILRGAAIPTGLAGVAATAVGLLVSGGQGALGAALGALVAIAFFSVSVVAVSYASKISPQMMFTAAVFSYITKIFVMFALIAVFRDTTAWDSQVFAYTIIALTLVWVVAEIRTTTRAKTLYVDDFEERSDASAARADAEAVSGPTTDRGP
jgi:ATP synthase protein I